MIAKDWWEGGRVGVCYLTVSVLMLCQDLSPHFKGGKSYVYVGIYFSGLSEKETKGWWKSEWLLLTILFLRIL